MFAVPEETLSCGLRNLEKDFGFSSEHDGRTVWIFQSWYVSDWLPCGASWGSQPVWMPRAMGGMVLAWIHLFLLLQKIPFAPRKPKAFI